MAVVPTWLTGNGGADVFAYSSDCKMDALVAGGDTIAGLRRQLRADGIAISGLGSSDVQSLCIGELAMCNTGIGTDYNSDIGELSSMQTLLLMHAGKLQLQLLGGVLSFDADIRR